MVHFSTSKEMKSADVGKAKYISMFRYLGIKAKISAVKFHFVNHHKSLHALVATLFIGLCMDRV